MSSIKRRTVGVLAGCALVTVTTAACSSGSSGGGGGGAGDTLVAAVSTEPSTLDPQLVNDRSSRLVTDNVFETLLVHDDAAQIKPWLATSYKAINDTTWEFKLRNDVTFQDGTPFNADAVVYSINRIIDPDYETQRTSYTEGLTGAKKVDDYTVDITSESVNPVVPSEVTSIPMVSEKTAAGKDFGQSVVVGTGPYKFVSWKHGQEIDLTRNDSYWGTAPSIKNFTVRVIPDSQTQLSALQTGEIGLMLDLSPEQAKLAPAVKEIKASDFSYVAFNTYKKELSSPLVRQALNYAVDKDLIAKSLYEGHAQPDAAQNLTPGSLGYNKSLTAFPYDPDKAKQLLAQAGYPNGFSLELHVPIGRYSKGEETAELVGQELDAIGVKTKVVKSEWNDYRDQGRIPGTKSGAFDLKYGWNSNEWFDAARITAHITCGGTSSKICDKKVDQLMDKGMSTLDPATRQSAYEQVWAELHENPYAIYLLQQNYIYGTSKNLTWTPRPDDVYLVSTMSLSK